MERKKQTSIWKILVGIIAALAAGVTFYFVYQQGQVNVSGNDNVIKYSPVPEKDPTKEKAPIHVWETQYIHSTDSKGREIDFVIAILSQEKRWELGSSVLLENNESFDKFFSGYLKSLPALDSCLALISFGVASEEGTPKGEFQRADKRADKILEILRPITKGKDLYKLNLGKYSSLKSEGETSAQRRVIIGGIKSRDATMEIEDIKYALFNGLKKQMKNKLGLELSDYSNFTFTNPN